MVQTEEERKAKKKMYYSRPEVKAKEKKRRSTSEYKAKQKKYSQRPEVKAKAKKRKSAPEYKAKARERQLRPEVKAKAKAKRDTPEYKVKRNKYLSRPEVKAKNKVLRNRPEVTIKRIAYRQRPENKVKAKAYRQRPENKAKAKVYKQTLEYKTKEKTTRDNKRLKLLQHYSQHLSTSSIPCCNCCGETFHVDFLAIDHITGKKQMDSEPELVRMGYNSKLDGLDLVNWITCNDFPEGFQILCHNCNHAKGMKKNNNKCPHEIAHKEEAFAMMEEQSSFEV